MNWKVINFFAVLIALVLFIVVMWLPIIPVNSAQAAKPTYHDRIGENFTIHVDDTTPPWMEKAVYEANVASPTDSYSSYWIRPVRITDIGLKDPVAVSMMFVVDYDKHLTPQTLAGLGVTMTRVLGMWVEVVQCDSSNVCFSSTDYYRSIRAN